jgi:molybdopterin/thiamine biosynthesis adenylyltransferase
VVEVEEQSGGCSICQLVVSYVETYLQQNATEKEIIQKLDALCANIPVFGPECDSVVSAYAPKIIEWIVNKEPPQAFCASVHICSAPKKVEESGPIPCSLCQISATYVDKWVSENASEQAIVQRLEHFCSVIGPLSPECQSFLAIYVPKLINWVVAKENPDTFCSQVGLCSSKQFFTYKGKIPRITRREEIEEEVEEEFDDEEKDLELFEEAQSAGCQVCQLITTYVEQLVANNSTVQEIEKQVENLCSDLGTQLGPLCDQMAVKYVPTLVTWIVKKENPQAFCSQVGLC